MAGNGWVNKYIKLVTSVIFIFLNMMIQYIQSYEYGKYTY